MPDLNLQSGCVKPVEFLGQDTGGSDAGKKKMGKEKGGVNNNDGSETWVVGWLWGVSG